MQNSGLGRDCTISTFGSKEQQQQRSNCGERRTRAKRG
jgi:hypothetical protein